MLGRVVEIEQPNRHLSLDRGFLVITQTGSERQELGRVALDDISVVIGSSFGLSYSNNLIVELAERNIIFMACGTNHIPQIFLMPVVGNYEQSRRFDAQISASLPLKKRAWAQIIKSKLEQQAIALETSNIDASRLWLLSGQVASGDPKNLEGVGAAYYFQRMFGRHFRRDVDQPGINAMLNYGYAVMRATVARAIVSAGLHPGLGIKHSNANNPMRLADDFIEPFRPLVDRTVASLIAEGETPTMSPEIKKLIVSCAYQDTYCAEGITPATSAVQTLVTSFAQVLLKQRSDLILPLTKPHKKTSALTASKS